MKNIMYVVLTVMFALSISACGISLDTDIDDAAQTLADAADAAGGAVDEYTHDEESDVDSATFEGSNEGDSDTGGGITVIEPAGYDDQAERFFMGTYSLGTNSGNYYSDYSQRCDADYNFPMVIRGYSHLDDNFVDFETNAGSLAWVAKTFEDETFDFSVRFLDTFGQPSIQLDCTCEIDEGYGDYYNDEVQCSCGGDDSCSLYYTKM